MKYVISILACLAALYGCVWLFNHVDAWIGIGSGIVWVVGTFYLFTNLIKTAVK